STFWRKLRELLDQLAVLVEQFFGLVAAHPLFEHPEMVGALRQFPERDLVRAKRVLDLFAVDDFWSGPTFGRSQHDHRELRTPRKTVCSSLLLNRLNLFDHLFQSRRHELMHSVGLVS